MERMSRLTKSVIGVIAVVTCVIAGAYAVPATRWRLKVIHMKQRGELNEIRWSQLLKMVGPGSPYQLRSLLTTRNLYLAIVNPFNGQSDVKAGADLFARRCSVCHGP